MACMWAKIRAFGLFKCSLGCVVCRPSPNIYVQFQGSLAPLCSARTSYPLYILFAALPFSEVYICHLLWCIKNRDKVLFVLFFYYFHVQFSLTPCTVGQGRQKQDPDHGKSVLHGADG